VNAAGLAERGLLVRHLVLPHSLAGTLQVARFLVEEISPDTAVNIMDQYRPAHQAGNHPALNRPVTAAEMQSALQSAQQAGLTAIMN